MDDTYRVWNLGKNTPFNIMSSEHERGSNLAILAVDFIDKISEHYNV